ncbi:hypothetical protein F5X99DRAFT_50387 [Biscogniauxia marginata]|nr:hypothetical protein F5X99DRAFT_50387 [Biscogniauxia marginata]
MKTAAFLSSLLLAAVSATPISEIPSQINVIGFTAMTEPHGDGASLSFRVTIPGTAVDQVSCSYADQTSVDLPDIPMTECEDPALRFQFRQDPTRPGTAEGRYRLVVTYTNPTPGGEGLAGYHEWDPADFAVTSDSTTDIIYKGEPDFTLTRA